MKHLFAVLVTLPGDDQRTQCILRNSAGAPELNVSDNVRGMWWTSWQGSYDLGASNWICPAGGFGFAGAGSCDCGTDSNGF